MKDIKKHIEPNAVEGRPIYSIFVSKCCDILNGFKVIRARYSKDDINNDPALNKLNEWRFE